MITPLPSLGDVVDIAITGVLVIDVIDAHADGYGRGIIVAIPSTNGHPPAHIPIRYESPNVTVTVVDPATPADWPPRVGDLWRDRDGDLWFAVDMNTADDPTGPCIEFVSTQQADPADPEDVRRQWGPVGLVFRAQHEAAK